MPPRGLLAPDPSGDLATSPVYFLTILSSFLSFTFG